jgi:3-keto-5-aminohexanoate cleavage enzyme
MEKLIITAAVTGSGPTRANNPNIPYSPAEIANEVIRAYEAGASIAHVHVRDPATGEPAFEFAYFQEVRDRVRDRCDILLNFTTSAFNLKGENIMERRVSPTELGPELCTLDIGSINFRNRMFINPPEWGPYCAKIARERGVKPELECFDTGHINLCKFLIEDGLLDPPYLFQLCMGTAGGIEASSKSFIFMLESLPKEEMVCTSLGIGRHQFPVAVMSILNGGHVRVGFEDNVYLSKGMLAKSNAELVEKAVRLARELGREIAEPDDTRRILKLPRLQ